MSIWPNSTLLSPPKLALTANHCLILLKVIGSFMRRLVADCHDIKNLPTWEERGRGWGYPTRPSVQPVAKGEGYRFVMRETCIVEPATRVVNRLFLCITQNVATKYMIKRSGDLISGILWITEGILILQEVLRSSLGNWWGRYRDWV